MSRPSRTRMKRALVLILVAWQLSLTVLLTAAGAGDRLIGALAGMLWGLDLLWIGGCGLLSLYGRERVRSIFRRTGPLPGLKFTLLATGLALLEEVVTIAMTNCAPLFGCRVGEVYITASANYLDVVALHSVVVFIPQFAAWAWLLSRHAFRPFEVFLLFGLTGFLNEAMFSGPNPASLAQWILVYGLMVYLPAYAFPDLPGRRPVRWWMFPIAVVLPILAAIPLVFLLTAVIAPGHPQIHFPPIGER
ncbi:hypothetical protein OJF2_09820 [Aquisphaera giovannonii]|uniref:Uncharacterized protein n=1 Tax=Aquisphaera giovannonii TaxID=406548 RepID=A0A5B9VXK4_9BACT|nr:hypothetical protein [Aquisphaera giovannonii]QEH32505.1 hypothetical protein OJF2_09820 [Aquisphaera giovannonii]